MAGSTTRDAISSRSTAATTCTRSRTSSCAPSGPRRECRSATWTAGVVETQVDPASGAVKVRKIVCAVDCGIVVNPDGARSQIEGSLLFGLSNALKERGTVKNGALEQSNFHDYQVLRMSDV